MVVDGGGCGAVVLPVTTALTLDRRGDVGGVTSGTVNLVPCAPAPTLYL